MLNIEYILAVSWDNVSDPLIHIFDIDQKDLEVWTELTLTFFFLVIHLTLKCLSALNFLFHKWPQ